MASVEEQKQSTNKENDDEKQSENQLLPIVQQNCSNLGKGIFKLTSLMNHQVDPTFIHLAVNKLKTDLVDGNKLSDSITKIITAPVSGVIPSFVMSTLLNVPTVYARHKVPVTFSKEHAIYKSEYSSHTKHTKSELLISAEYLNADDKVLIIDDVLATGKTAIALMELCRKANVTIVGAGFIMEKEFENGRDTVKAWCTENKVDLFPMESAMIIVNMEDKVGGKIEYKM